MVVRTATTFVRLTQIAEHLLSDTRVQVVFTICDGRSAYGRNLEQRIIAHGCIYIPWSQTRTMEFDLAIAASLNGPLAEIRAPLLLIDHGPGHTKNISIPAEEDANWKALVAASNYRRILAFTNDGEDAFFPDSFEKLVVGDPMLDAVVAATRRREQYRAELTIGNRKLITLSSTWGERASFAKMPSLANYLLKNLPSSEFAIASILHPNIWIGHGEWQVRLWYRDALEAGMILVPFDDAWQAVLAASDCVMGDHGSVALYASMAGIPLARISYDQADMKSEMAMVAATASTPLVATPEQALEFAVTSHSVDESAAERVRRSAFANVGKATQMLCSLIYEVLDIEPNEALKAPYDFKLKVRPQLPTSYFVTIEERVAGPHSLSLYAAPVGRSEVTRDAVLVSCIEEGNYRLLQNCDAVICSERSASSWRSLCPSARLTLVPVDSAWSAELRDGSGLMVSSELDDGFAICAAVLSLIERESQQDEFSCGAASGFVSASHQAPNH